MDENVAVREVGLAVMSVGDTDDGNRISEWLGWDNLWPSVKFPREEDAGLG